MKKVEMHVEREFFDGIVSGKKKVEVRIYDDKRKKLQVGDVIEFISRNDSSKRIEKTIAGLKRFRSFVEFDKAYPKEITTDIYKYYTSAEEKQYGVLAIVLK